MAERVADRLYAALIATAVMLAIAAIGQLWMYRLHVINQTEPVAKGAVTFGGILVVGGGWAALLGMVLCLVLAAMWLTRARAAAFAQYDEVDPRPMWMLYLGVLVPIVNLVAPVLFIAELRQRASMTERTVARLRLTYWLWVASQVVSLIVAIVAWQAENPALAANVVLVAAIADMLAVVLCLVAARTLRRIDEVTLDEVKSVDEEFSARRKWVLAR